MITAQIRRRSLTALAAITTLASLLPAAPARAATAPPPPVRTGAVVTPAAHMDSSMPLREILENQDQQGQHENYRPKPLPGTGARRSAAPGTPSATTASAMPATAGNFDGVGNGFSGPAGTFTVNSAPPDTNLAVGTNHVVEIVNSSFAIFNKTGSVLYGPAAINTLWSGFGGGCQANNDGDPIAKYDSIADRWVISQFSVTTTPYLQCVAVSQTADPTGAYYRYSFQYSDFPDYPKMSVWPDAYYITFNMFAGGNTFSGPQACAYDRAKMLSGQAATQQCFANLGTSYGGLLPSDLDGATLPTAGTPNTIMADGAGPNQLAYWQFHVDWATPANTTLSGPTTLATAAFSMPCGGTGGTCIPQAGTSQQLDTLGDRLMYRLAYRKFSDHEAWVVDRSVTAGGGTGIRWYELRPAGGQPAIYQQGTYAPDSDSRWMGSIAQDASGNLAMGFSLSGSGRHPEIRYTGRLAGDAAGTMTQAEGTIIAGAGSQTANLARWGDYSAMAVDPVDGCTFWYGNEYIPSNGTFNWRTRIANFKFPSCGAAAPANDFSVAASPASQTVNQGAGTSYSVTTATTAGSAQTVNLSASGLPAGATATFNPTSVTSGASSTMSVTTAASTPGGTYTVTITGTGATTHTTTVTLVVNGPAGIVNGGFEVGTFSGWTVAGRTSISTAAHTGTYAGMAGSTSPTNGDSTIAQTFTAPNPTGPLSFWYKIVCPDTVTYDWASATLVDNTAGTTSTPLAKTCSNTGSWAQSSPASLVGGHSYTLTLLSHDDNYSSDPTYTLFDDVVLAPPPTPDFTIAVSPASQTVVQGASSTYSVTVTATNGFTGNVSLSASGFGAGVANSFNPASVASSGTSTLTVTAASTATTGSFPVTVTGSSGTLSHSAGATLVVNPPPDFTISASPSTQTITQGQSAAYTVTIAAVNSFNGTVSLAVSGLPSGASGTFSPASVNAAGTSTLTVSSAPVSNSSLTITGTSGSLTHSVGVTLTVNPAPATVINNGGFETGNLSGWSTMGATSISRTSHTGTYSAQVGSSSPYNGDSSVAQTFTAPASGSHSLSFWYQVVCTDTVSYDWATATLKDNTSNATTTVLAKTCTNSSSWVQKTVSLTAGHSYTFTFIDHDDNWANPPDPTYTLLDDVTVT